MSFRVVRSAQASWQGTAPEGTGRITLGSGALDGPYSLRARVEDCTVSRALTGTEITLEATLAGD